MKIQHVQWFDQMDLIAAFQFSVCHFPYSGIHVDRIDHFDIREIICNTAYCPEHLMQRFTQIFTAMGSHENQF